MSGLNQYNHADNSRWKNILEHYCHCKQRLRRFRQLRAASSGTLVYFIAKLIFLSSSNAQYYAEWMLIAIAGILLSLPMVIYAHLSLRWLTRQTRHISRDMFRAGLRVDDDDRLVTNTAHTQLIARIGRPALEQ